MPFVQRNADGKITGYWTSPQTDEQRRLGEDSSPDWLPNDHPEIIEFHRSAQRGMAHVLREAGRNAQSATPFAPSRLKLRRASDHIEELDRNIAQYVYREPVLVTTSKHPELGYYAWRTECVLAAPTYLAAIFGDAIHNMRSALDLLAVDLVRLKKKSERKVRFPFAASADELDEQIKESNLRRAGPEVVDLIRSLRPFKDGNAALRYIHDLDVMDKHQMTLPASVYITWDSGRLLTDHRVLAVGRLSGGIAKSSPLPNFGTVPARVAFVIPSDAPILAHDHHIMLHGQPKITDVLQEFVNELSRIVDAFQLLCFGTATE